MKIGWGCLTRGASALAARQSICRIIGWGLLTFVIANDATEVAAQGSASILTERYEEWGRGAEPRGASPEGAPGPVARRAAQERMSRERGEDGSRHTVQSGETLFRIAKRYDVTVETLQRANAIDDPTTLRVGQTLVIPDASHSAREWRRSEDRIEEDRTPRARPRDPYHAGPSDHDDRSARRWRAPGDNRPEPRVSGLRSLAETMREPAGAARNSEMPAGYTFFAQLVGADLEVTRMLRAQLEGNVSGQRVSAELDLDFIYGAGPDTNPERFYLPYIQTGPRLSRAGKRYALSRAIAPAGHLFVVQLQAALIELHNRTVDLLIERHFARDKSRYCRGDCSNAELARALPETKQRLLFDDARETVIHYYHRVIVEDFLPRLIGEDRTKDIITNGRDVFFPAGFRDGEAIKTPFIPYEFALAAYQFISSQIRASYRMRAHERARRLDPAALMANRVLRDRLGKSELADWRYFVDILPEPPEGFNWARLIDPYIVSTERGWRDSRRPSSGSAEAILIAGARAGLPSGQDVAHKLLPDLRRRGLLYLWEPSGNSGRGQDELWRDYVVSPDRPVREMMRGHAPLWYYVLQEARAFGGPTGFGADTQAYKVSSAEGAQYAAARDSIRDAVRHRGAAGHTLGPVGGTIVGEVLIGLAEHYAIKTGKGLGFKPPIGASAYGERERFTLTRVRADSGELGERYLLRNLLIDAGVAVALD